MKLRLISWNGHTINDGTNYTAVDQTPQLLAKAEAAFAKRHGEYEKYAGLEYGHKTMYVGIAIEGSYHTLRDQLKGWFFEDRDTPKELLAKDVLDSDKQWYGMCVCVDLIEEGHIVTAVLEMEEPFWRQKVASSDTWSVTSSGSYRDISVGGTAKAKPIITVTPKQAKSGDYNYKRFVCIINPTSRAMTDVYLDVTGQTGKQLNTSTLVSGSKMQSDGDDWRLWMDGKEINSWKTGVNTATSGLHTADIALKPGIVLTLSGSVASTGAVSSITVKSTPANKTALQKLRTMTNKVVAIKTGSSVELFTFTDTNPNAYQITGTTREQKGMGKIAHSDGDSIYWVEHDIYMLYGNASATAQVVDDTRKPLQDLTNSTNAAPVWAEFFDADASRPGAWQKKKLKSVGTLSDLYTATEGAEANPASVLGMMMRVWQVGTVWKDETANLGWSIYDPVGLTSVGIGSGKKRRGGTRWPAKATLQKSNDQAKWIDVATEAKPSAANTWEATTTLTGTKSLSGTYLAVQIAFSGSIEKTPNNETGLELDGLTLNRDTANVPLIFVSSEISNYMLNETIYNQTTGETMVLTYHGAIDQPVVIDCEARTITYADGSSILNALTRSGDWFSFAPGVTNRVYVTDAGLVEVTHKFDWENRGL